MKNIVYVTGCAGFIGSHLTRRLLQEGTYVIGVDKMTYASNPEVIEEFKIYRNFKFIQDDINNLDRLYDCDYVINTCAETHVDNSIASSDEFIRSNVNGVHHLLKLINQKSHSKVPILLHFSTDEVYGDIDIGFHTEMDLLKPSNPYSATKAAADMLILAWARTFKLPYVIVRPTNNYGVCQYVEKLIPKSIKYMNLGRKIELHNNGTPRRTWLHVNDTVNAVLKIIESGVTNEIYNISGNYETENIDVVRKIILNIKGFEVHDVSQYVELFTRPGQDVRYAIDDSKLKSLGWKPLANFDDELRHIVGIEINRLVW